MPPTRKAKARPSTRSRAGARASSTTHDKTIARITKSLETAQKDLAAIGGTLAAGTSDMGKDVAKLLKDASRDVTKMGKAVRRDVERLQKDVTVPAKPKARSTGAKKARTTRKASRGKAAKRAKSATKTATRAASKTAAKAAGKATAKTTRTSRARRAK